ncbi:UNVERIFIED_CONTAM: hypothetical protein PYX00_010283 [Menopon gallinae]|uniref:Uncharacterized protein n=1 Tax=Menopon gallinae TaxID=328185 RepID=A0AAW2HEP7_9NEOP
MFGMWIKFTAVLFIIISQDSVGAEKCREVGMICDSSKKLLQMCQKLGDEPRIVRDCSKEGLVCIKNATATTCVKPERAKFTCLAEGEFPDPLDCKTSYVCSAEKQVAAICKCKDNYFSYPTTGVPCVLSDKCPRKDVKCDEVGKTGSFEGNDGTRLIFSYYCFDKTGTKVSSFNREGKQSPSYQQNGIKECRNIE